MVLDVSDNASSLENAPTMHELPNEILHMICSYLDPWDIKSTLWLSKRCAAVGLHYLIPVVHVALLQESIAKLHAFADHPVLRHHVHTVLFSPVLFRRHPTFAVIKKNVHVPSAEREAILDTTKFLACSSERDKRRLILAVKRSCRHVIHPNKPRKRGRHIKLPARASSCFIICSPRRSATNSWLSSPVSAAFDTTGNTAGLVKIDLQCIIPSTMKSIYKCLGTCSINSTITYYCRL